MQDHVSFVPSSTFKLKPFSRCKCTDVDQQQLSGNHRTIHVNTTLRQYPVHIGNGLLRCEELFMRYCANRQVLIVTDTRVAPHYLETVRLSCRRSAVVRNLAIPDGESLKNLSTVESIYLYAHAEGFDKHSMFIALGGGVIGDITGFSAATYFRGVPYLQVPTTMIGQVDSAVGGKTGVNFGGFKNLIGAIYQPAAVIADVATLRTLSEPHYRSGLAEVVKYGLAGDKVMFEWCEHVARQLKSRYPPTVEDAVVRSCTRKAQIVSEDEYECKSNGRVLLNLGHTFGHAIEAVGFGSDVHGPSPITIPNIGDDVTGEAVVQERNCETSGKSGTMHHGEAVAVGCVMAAWMSKEMGLLHHEEYARIVRLFRNLNLPTSPPAGQSDKDLLTAIHRDKKVKGGVPSLVLLRGIGQAFVTRAYDPDLLRTCLAVFSNSNMV